MDFSLSSPTPSLTPSLGSPPPGIPVQPDHFYRADDSNYAPASPRFFDGTTWYDPEDDRLASRGIPVFKPTMEEFRDFEAYMNRVECWGKYSGIVKVIPPNEWRDALPSVKTQLSSVQIKTPIEQHMLGQTGLFRQQNVEKSKTMSVREWAELCGQPDFRAPSVEELGLHGRALTVSAKTRKSRKSKIDTQVRVKEEPVDDGLSAPPSLSGSATAGQEEIKPKFRNGKRKLTDSERLSKDAAFLETFDPDVDWLPFSTKPEDYTPEFCAKLERQYWRNLGLGKAPWYGADTQGSLYTDETTEWNVAHLESELTRLLPSSSKGLPGVNTPYLYWGMWRATFAWHVEDMDLFSINYIHFGAPKHWYAIPQGRASALEQTMRSYFPKDTSQCPQFLRHKSFLASPTLLAKSSCKPNTLVQHAGEFVITYPRGYHAGFNLGLNCAESVNFALKSWIEIGKIAKACKCISDRHVIYLYARLASTHVYFYSVIIDVNQLIADREMEREMGLNNPQASKPQSKAFRAKRPSSQSSPTEHKNEGVYVLVPPLAWATSKRKAVSTPENTQAAKKSKKYKAPTITLPSQSSKSLPKLSIKLKLGPKVEPEVFPCCLCVSLSIEGLLRVHDPPYRRKEALEACSHPTVWSAHETCANVVPETWVDEVENESGEKEKAVFGVDGIVKDRWNLKCSSCTRNRPKAHGAPIQCTRGKCLKAFHVSCAQNGKENDIVFNVIREVEKEVVLLDPTSSSHMQVDTRTAAANSFVAGGSNDTMSPANATQGSDVLKRITKFEVQLLCAQHNPAVAFAKKTLKQDKIKTELLALQPMSRIKLRVTAGVFEVSLVRVIEESGSIEVLWDRGLKREFKWSSLVFGKTDVFPNPDTAVAYPIFSGPLAQDNSPTLSIAGTSSTFSLPLASSTSQTYSPLTPFPYAAYSPYRYGNYSLQGQASASDYPSTSFSGTDSASTSRQGEHRSYLWRQPATPVQHPSSSKSQNLVPSCPPSEKATPTSSSAPFCPFPDTPSFEINVAHPPTGTHPSQISGHAPIGILSTQAPDSSQPRTVSTVPSESLPVEGTVQAPFLDFEALKALPPDQLAHLLQNNVALRNILLGFPAGS
ncbi:hypothetical protein D9757_006174 [Collybiopsis confluens]|uniref:[histone H3]-trimethyl-L-lysine(9) demethylase n=1 Tax=Collybiopsis confluens TaxID=2823264 RepID=A0A8H5HHJ0_9AGAR|nr:hypothetical protein D9757_006174 [Collybiopsis confluens]